MYYIGYPPPRATIFLCADRVMRRKQVKIVSTGELYPVMPPDSLARGGDLGPGSARNEAIVAASRQREKCPPRDWGVQEVGV